MWNSGDTIKKRLKQREDMFLRRLFGMLAKMAKADGKVDAWETHAAEGAFSRFPRAAARRKFCVRVFNESKRSRISLYRQAWEFSNKYASAADCLAVYELLWDIACATGLLKAVHKDNLKGICKYLNLPEAYFNIYFRKRSGTFREWTYSDQKAQEETHRSKRKETHERTRREPPPRPKTALQRAYELIGCSSNADDATRTSSAPPARLRGVLRRLRSRWRGSTMPGTRSARQEGCDDILPIGG